MASDDTPNEKTAHIHLKVDQETKESWELHVDRRNDIPTLSALIRLAVSKEVAGEYQEDEDRYDEVVDALADIEGSLSLVTEQLQSLQDRNINPNEMEDMVGTVIDRMEELHEEEA